MESAGHATTVPDSVPVYSFMRRTTNTIPLLVG